MPTSDIRAWSAYNAGFRGNDLLTALAISLAAGSGPSATNNTARPELPGYKPVGPGAQPEYSVGPWQIDLQQHASAISEDAARAWDTSAKFAYSLAHSGSGFGQWSEYTTGAYKGFFAQAAELIKGLPLDATQPPINPAINGGGATAPSGAVNDWLSGNLPDWLKGIPSAWLNSAKNLIDPHWWAKIIISAFAVGLALAGLLMYLQGKPSIQRAEKSAAEVAA